VESRTLSRTLWAGLGGLALAACAVEYAPPTTRHAETVPSADTTMVLTELRSYYRDLSARNWLAFSDHFWPGATIATRWQPAGEDSLRVWTTTVPEFVAAAPMGPDSRAIFEESMLDARIRLVGDLAQAWVTYRARFGDPGAVEEWEGVDAFTLLQHAGRWRIVSLTFGRTDGGP
jgi:hypothetical protein